MKKIIRVLILFMLSSLVFCQTTVNINKNINGYESNGSYGTIVITPEYYKIEIKPYWIDRYLESHSVSYDEFYVGDLIPVKVRDYVLGTEGSSHKSFYVDVPRQYKELYISGINEFGNNTSLDLTPFNEYVKARTGRKGLDDSEKPKISLNYPKLTDNFYRTEELFITLEGKATDNMGLLSMMVNGQKVKVSDNGYYKKRLKLKLGKNTVILKAEDINNNTASYDFVIIRDEIIEDTEFSDVD